MFLSKAASLSVGFALAASVCASIACAPPANKTELKICNPGENGCPSADSPLKDKKSRSNGGDDLEASESEVTSGWIGTATSDAGADTDADAAPAPLGRSCTQLKACCDYMVDNGILADFCLEALGTRLESVCYTKYQSYQSDPEMQLCP